MKTIGVKIIVLAIALAAGVLFMAQTTASESDHTAALKNPDGSWKYTNALIHESSPYLLQHAHNPVDWHPWGPKAFQLARETGKPIFLSVGYSTCYWCHVMERQVFENPKLAALLNKHFIPIKVDREQRPDVDDIYMAAVQIMTQRGGWPMSVFLTPPGAAGPGDPGLKPFWAGTYIPPEPSYGMPGFAQVVTGLANAWDQQKPQVLGQANNIAKTVQDHLSHADKPAPVTLNLVQDAANQLLRSYDQDNAGFGQAPKFPQPSNLLLLLSVYQNNPQNNPDQDLAHAIAHTLDRMARGGIYDHVAGGFHRYSTDAKWLIPHFEKMLYDNAQLVEVYILAKRLLPAPKDPNLYTRVVQQTCDYVLREMTDDSGAFWSAQDAEVNAREGGNYLWTPKQIQQAIPDHTLAQLAISMYGLDQGTNFQDPHHQDEPPSNVLYLPIPLSECAETNNLSLDDLVAAQNTINQQLLAVRDTRQQPTTDDKVLVAWNGLMIAALADAGQALDEPRYTHAAAKAAAYILEHMRTSDTGLYRSMRLGQNQTPAFLEDYAFFVHGLIQLYRTTQQDRWLNASKDLMNLATQKFSAQQDHAGGYYDTLADQPDLFVRTISTYDGAIPSGNSQMIHNLIDLWQLTNQDHYLDRAIVDLQSFAHPLARLGQGMAYMQYALARVIQAQPDRFANQTPQPEPAPDSQILTVSVQPDILDLSSGSTDLTVTLTIAKGYHLNAHQPGDPSLIPTQLELLPASPLQLTVQYPPGRVEQYPFADAPLNVYDGTITLQATVHAPATKATERNPQLILHYQACTQDRCLAPITTQIPIRIKSTPSN